MRKKSKEKIPLIQPLSILPPLKEESSAEYEEAKKHILISSLNQKRKEYPILKDRLILLQEAVLEIQEVCLDVKQQLVEQNIELKIRAFNKHIIRELLNLNSSSSSNQFLLK